MPELQAEVYFVLSGTFLNWIGIRDLPFLCSRQEPKKSFGGSGASTWEPDDDVIANYCIRMVGKFSPEFWSFVDFWPDMAGFVSTKFSSHTMFGDLVIEIGQALIRKFLVPDWVRYKLSVVQWVLDWVQRVASNLKYCSWQELPPLPMKD